MVVSFKKNPPQKIALLFNDIVLIVFQIESNLSLYSPYYAEACSELAGPISESMCPGNTAFFEKIP